jgi:4,5-dihydroxyphthalate decarboxylase
LAFNLFAAFVKAKDAWYAQLNSKIPSDMIFGPQYMAQTRSLFGSDPYPYGIKDNATMMQTMIDFSHEQGFIPNKLAFEEIFAPNIMDL